MGRLEIKNNELSQVKSAEKTLQSICYKFCWQKKNWHVIGKMLTEI